MSNKGHFRSLHMMLDVCKKSEGSLFSTKICAVGSYTDVLLNILSCSSANYFCRSFSKSWIKIAERWENNDIHQYLWKIFPTDVFYWSLQDWLLVIFSCR